MKRIILTLVFAVSLVSNCLAQNNGQKSTESFIKDRVSFTFGLGYNAQPSYYESNRYVASLELLKGKNHWFELGPYITYLTEDVYMIRVNILDYGIKGRVHFLPLIIDPSFYKIDVYANIEVGGHSVFFNKHTGIDNYTKLSINTGGGIGYYFSPYFGLFVEFNHNNIYDFNYRFGYMFRL